MFGATAGDLERQINRIIIDAKVAKTVTSFLRYRCPFSARTLCYIVIFLVTVEEEDNKSLRVPLEVLATLEALTLVFRVKPELFQARSYSPYQKFE